MGANYSMNRDDCFEYVIENAYLPAFVGAYIGFAKQHRKGYAVAPGVGVLRDQWSQFRTMAGPTLLWGGSAATYLALDCAVSHAVGKRDWKGPAIAGATTAYMLGGWKGWPQCAGYPMAGAFLALVFYATFEVLPVVRQTGYRRNWGPTPYLEFLEDPEPLRPPAKRPYRPFLFKNKDVDPQEYLLRPEGFGH